MLSYFIHKKSIAQINQICESLNKTKNKLQNNIWSNPTEYFDPCISLFSEIKEIAIRSNDEALANAQFVFKHYFLFFCDLIRYFGMLENNQYKESWNKLQDCLDSIKYIGRFTKIENRLELDELYELLIKYENLYPYRVFTSSEYVISKTHCSICGKSMQSLECSHIKGNLYWGEPAVEIIDEIQAVCIVSHPEDKRCILEMSDDTRTEKEKFILLDQFLEMKMPFLQQFEIQERKEIRRRNDIKKVGRNQPCSCGSGKKFKRCCEKNMYYEYTNNIVSPNTIVELRTI